MSNVVPLRTRYRPRPSDAEFEELKRKRDEALREVVRAACEQQGWDPAKTSFHCSSMSGCYCACPDGPCQHLWNGPQVEDGCMVTSTCSLCGAWAVSHSLRTCDL